jgi:hypothetical protein
MMIAALLLQAAAPPGWHSTQSPPLFDFKEALAAYDVPGVCKTTEAKNGFQGWECRPAKSPWPNDAHRCQGFNGRSDIKARVTCPKPSKEARP